MKLDHEQYELMMTALQNYRGELYINSGDPTVLNKVNDLCQAIENEKKALDLDQKKIPVTEDMYEVGSETGIEEEYALQTKPNCENCDE